MAEVTGPISTLPGARHALPAGTMCDEHPDRPAVARVQGETDSFGCELNDLLRGVHSGRPRRRHKRSMRLVQEERPSPPSSPRLGRGDVRSSL